MKYAVRCCCQPRKVFGWLELPEGLRDGQRLPLRPKFGLVDRSSALINPPPIETVLIRTFGEVVDGEVRRGLAVCSEDRPESFWRGLPNFTPAEDGQ